MALVEMALSKEGSKPLRLEGLLVIALEQLLLNPDKARAMGAAGQKVVHQKFSAGRMAEELCGVLKALV